MYKVYSCTNRTYTWIKHPWSVVGFNKFHFSHIDAIVVWLQNISKLKKLIFVKVNFANLCLM